MLRWVTRFRNLCAFRDEDGIANTRVKGSNEVASIFARNVGSSTAFAGVVEDANHGRIVALENAGDAAFAAAVALGWTYFDQNLIALHGAIDFIGWNKDV